MPAPIPVYQVVLRLGCGGLEKVVIHLARALDPSRYRVTVCCLEDPGELAGELEGSHVPVVCLGKQGFQASAWWRLARNLRSQGVGIVHTHNPAAHLYGTVAARAGGVRCVVHTRHSRRPDVIRSPALRNGLWKLTNAVVAVSPDTADHFLQNNKACQESITTIPNGVPVPEFKPRDRAAIRAEFGIPAEAPLIGNIARLEPEKAQNILLSAFAAVRRQFPEAHLVIVGKGTLRDELERRAVELGIASHVHFAGYRPDVPRFLAAIDISVLCSSWEGAPLSLLEAMGAALPIVATAVGGMPALLGGAENGHLIAPADEGALARSLMSLLSDPTGGRVMGARARAHMREHYGVETMARQYEALYDDLLRPRRPEALV